jgi:hypothetical protein
MTPATGPQKAIWGATVSAVIAFLSAVLAGLLAVGDGATLGDLDTAVWITAIIAALTAAVGTGGTVYQVTNKPKT